MDSGKDLQRQMEGLRRLLTGDPASAVGGDYFAQPAKEKHLLTGSAVQALGIPYSQRPSGLFVPQSLASGPAPIDLVATYITYQELTGADCTWPEIVTILKATNLGQVLEFTTKWLAKWNFEDQNEVDSSYIGMNFQGARGRSASSLMRDGRVIVAPQMLHVLCKLALLLCPDDAEGIPAETLALLPLGIGELLGNENRQEEIGKVHIDGVPGNLTQELISNQHFNQRVDVASALGRFTRRWREIPNESPHSDLGSMEDLFTAAVGVTFDELEIVAIAIYSSMLGGASPFFSEGFFAEIGLPKDRALAALKVISCSLPGLRDAIVADFNELGGGFAWSISAFERFPIIWADDAIVVTDPKLLISRVFGWLPFFDVYSTLTKKQQGQFRDYAGRISEKYATEVISSIAPHAIEKRFYTEEDLRAAYGKSRKVADAVLDYGGCWIVIDISTRQLMRGSVAATSAEDVKRDLDALAVKKAYQIQSTIDCLRANESALTGHDGIPNRRFIPVVIASEGFPVSPFTTSMIEDALRNEGVLQDGDIEPLQIMDTTELELIEALEEKGLSTFAKILRGKPQAGLAKMPVRDYVSIELGLFPERSSRMNELWKKPFERMRLKAFPDEEPLL